MLCLICRLDLLDEGVGDDDGGKVVSSCEHCVYVGKSPSIAIGEMGGDVYAVLDLDLCSFEGGCCLVVGRCGCGCSGCSGGGRIGVCGGSR